MRLLQVSDLKLVEFLPDSIPPYAILSHTWGKDEVLFEDILNNTATNKSAYVKVEGAAKQASANNLEYVWIDNCCIDKSSSAELSEALNSMFAWYENASVCYAYLSDVPSNVNVNDPASEFTRSRWFTRGFTLQELLAPREVIFFSSAWEVIGKKTELYEILSAITGIGIQYLRHKAPLSSASIANRMSWVANRETSRPEDIAYCLLGIFNINMPLLYGERDRAFIRLQEEIMRQSDDQSIFAWRDLDADPNALHGLLARSPKQFASSKDIIPYENWEVLAPYSMTNRGLRIDFHLKESLKEEDVYIASLNCPMPPIYKDGSFLGIFLKKLTSGDEQYARVNINEFHPVHNDRGRLQNIFVRQTMHNALVIDRGIFPYHVAQLRNGPRFNPHILNDCGFEVVQVIFPELSNQIQHFKSAESTPEFIHASEEARKDWLPAHLPHQFSLPKSSKSLAGAVILQKRTDSQRVAILLGSREGFDVGFDAIPLGHDFDLNRPTQQALDVLQGRFQPKPVGNIIHLGRICIMIHVSLWIYHGIKYYMVDLIVHGDINQAATRRISGNNRRVHRISMSHPAVYRLPGDS
ncbi:hypothetical protein ASPCADRAFT_507032 [Aspergillus carbonarius ITEM 5010]|uniref:Uncharacterized protein n=1 Tax=Aspergillus carbonarius (strain ITEM 5010) TaxID=602072 RepID=A0A1R3RKX0_ASPC5|nr:hypothetical protein ASPCADRAFT_130543 [Aspergillus carbonarius ITEM 5010]OOF95110.1 hypothetical protein ASPCADRAFT_507032 [Aspergillus carbonarius ITEM 5010]